MAGFGFSSWQLHAPNPKGRPGAYSPYTTLGWSVSDIRQTVQTLRAAGVVFERYAGMNQDADGVWPAPSGARVAWFKDPDGHTLSLTQFE